MDVVRFRWNGSQLVDISGAPEIPLYVADSFLLNNGSVVALEKHLTRFSQSAQEQGLIRPLDEFLTAVIAALPLEGSYFPRIDLTERGELELRLRPTPPLRSSTSLITAASDPRTEPAIKGPDIPALAELQSWARTQGADEAVIVDEAGHIVDGATTCLVWGQADTLYIPPVSMPRVASVTVEVFREITTAAGLSWQEASVRPAELQGFCLLALNALHGIQPVTAWIGGPQLQQDPRVTSWRTDYENTARKVR